MKRTNEEYEKRLDELAADFKYWGKVKVVCVAVSISSAAVAVIINLLLIGPDLLKRLGF